MAYEYDITVRVNLTMKYPDKQSASDVKDDAHSVLSDFHRQYGELDVWACDVEGGHASLISGDE